MEKGEIPARYGEEIFSGRGVRHCPIAGQGSKGSKPVWVKTWTFMQSSDNTPSPVVWSLAMACAEPGVGLRDPRGLWCGGRCPCPRQEGAGPIPSSIPAAHGSGSDTMAAMEPGASLLSAALPVPAGGRAPEAREPRLRGTGSGGSRRHVAAGAGGRAGPGGPGGRGGGGSGARGLVRVGGAVRARALGRARAGGSAGRHRAALLGRHRRRRRPAAHRRHPPAGRAPGAPAGQGGSAEGALREGLREGPRNKHRNSFVAAGLGFFLRNFVTFCALVGCKSGAAIALSCSGVTYAVGSDFVHCQGVSWWPLFYYSLFIFIYIIYIFLSCITHLYITYNIS